MINLDDPAIHPLKRAAYWSHAPKKAARATGVQAGEIRRIRALREARARSKGSDPLETASLNRRWRLKARREARAAHAAAALAAGVRKTLLAAAREARKAGFTVRKSENRCGRVSSYYVRLGTGPQIRISEHVIPTNLAREARAIDATGFGYAGYPGPEILIDRERSALWIQRALTLAMRGRSVGAAA